MIDYFHVLSTSLWIFGGSLILAALSIAQYAAAVSSVQFRTVVERSGYLIALYWGFVFIAVGFALGDPRIISRILWGLLITLATITYIDRRRGLYPGNSAEDIED